ncbi:MAG: hypothetical protein QUS14_12625 [Pyrinomonadaceae bacterium]|nr:hypothetical protein [Pyrinomonadaceae bacterium]
MTHKTVIRFAFIVAMTALSASAALAQGVRLRSQIAPTCATSSSLKFADIFAEGNIAVMGSYNCRGAFIFDISNPDSPQLASWYNPGANQQFLEAIVLNGRGYFGSGNSGGVHIVDLSNPANPQLLGTVNSTNGGGHNSIHEMMVIEQNGGIYLIENSNSTSVKTIKIINVTNPSSPVFVRDLVPTEVQWIHAMHIRGNKMYTSGWGNSSFRARTEIYDISNLTTQQPQLLGAIEDPSASVTAGNSMHSSWTSEDGNYLYSAREVTNSNGASPGDIRVYDVRTPSTPLLIKRISMNDLGLNAVTPHNPVVKGNRLYVSWYQAGLQVFDISKPEDPIRIGQYDTFPTVFSPEESAKEISTVSDPWDIMCGSDSLQNALPTTYAGAWAVFPFLGDDKVLIGDLATGLYAVDVTGLNQPAKNVVSDFDGDRKTDISIYRPTTGQWIYEASSTSGSSSTFFGLPEDQIVTGDYDADGKSDFAVWRPSTGVWYVIGSTSGFMASQFGANGDVPVPADYDADGKTDFAVWRPSNGVWYVLQSKLGIRFVQWGVNGDKPLTGDFEGDGKADLAIWRPSTGTWYVMQSSSSLPLFTTFGLAGDKPLVADMNGDGRSDYTIFRPSTGVWYMLSSSNNAFSAYQFGIAEDIPVPADYDGDGKSDIAVFRPSSGVWYRINSSDGAFDARSFGVGGDLPSPSSVQPR